MTGADPLAGLRAYHLPDAPSWWPPAPGWWVLALLLLVAAVSSAWWIARRRRCHAAARQAERELGQLHANLKEHGDARAFVRGLSKLLRRFALAAFARREVASLTGDDWLKFLDRHGGGGRFLAGPGRQLLEAPYRPSVDVSTEDLLVLVQEWIRHNQEVCR